MGDTLDLFGAKASRDEAMARVERNARERYNAFALLVARQVASRQDTFTANDVRDEMARLDPTIQTHTDKALGPIMKKLAPHVAVPTGEIRNSARKRNHHRALRVWKSKIFPGTRRGAANHVSGREDPEPALSHDRGSA